MSHLNRIEILRKLQAKEITSAQAYALLQQITGETGTGASTSLTYTRAFERSDRTEQAAALGNVLVLDKDSSLADALRQRSALSGTFVRVRPGSGFRQESDLSFEVNPERTEDFEQLLAALDRQNVRIDCVVNGWTQEKNSANSARLPDRLQEQLRLGVSAWLSLSQAFVKRKLRQTVTLVQLVSQSSIGGAGEPQQIAMAGFFRSLRLESPYLLGKTVEIQGTGSATADLIFRELQIPVAQEPEVRYQNGVRYAKKFQEIDLAASKEHPLPFKERGVYLITGGLGGLGLIFAEHLAAKYRARLVLSGRSALQAETRAKIERLEALGAEVLYVSADIANRQDVEQLVKTAKSRFGQIEGVLHSAGVLRDSFLLNKTKQEMVDVLAPKVFGTVHLDEATSREPLDFFVLFSSTAAVMGNAGQCDYAYGNSFMDAYAEHRDGLRAQNARSGRSLSINWPLWLEGGMHVDAQTVEAMKRATGLVPLPKESGLSRFEAGLCIAFTQLVVLQGDATKIRTLISAERQQVESRPAQVSASVPAPSDLKEKTEQFLKKVLADAIKLSVDRIDAEASLDHYGLDSVMIARLTRDLEGYFGNLPKTLFFEYQTLGELAGFFLEQQADKLPIILGLQQSPAAASEQSATPAAKAIAEPRNNRKQQGPRGPRFAPSKAASLSHSDMQEDEIAIIGVAGRYPQANNLEEFWHNLRSGKDSITEIPKDRWDVDSFFDTDRSKTGKMYSKWGGFIDDVDKFDPLFFNISPSEAEFMDPQERLFLQTVWETIEDAGYTRQRLGKDTVGVFVGAMYGHYQLLGLEGLWTGTSAAVGSFHSSIANRISYHLNLNGPSIAMDTMCSSSLTAIHLACESIRRGESSLAIAGGVNVSIHPLKYILLSQTGFAASDGRCRAFGEGGDGYVPGEGVGAVLLKPLQKAIADGDPIYAVIKSTTINHGGKTNGFTVPNPTAQAHLIADALKKAKIDPRTISYLEAHGTGTSLGDPIEIAGLMKAFREYTKDRQFCSIGSVKSNVGHLESAAGIAGITKVLLQMKHRELLPSLHADTLNSNISFEDTAFYVQRELSQWEQEGTTPRRAGVSAFGAGGSNAHIILEEYVPRATSSVSRNSTPQLIVLSARTAETLQKKAADLLTFLQEQGLYRSAGVSTPVLNEFEAGQSLLHDLKIAVAKLLNISVEEISEDENLEEYGFDAIKLAELADLLNQRYGLEISPSLLSVQTSLQTFTNDLITKQGADVLRLVAATAPPVETNGTGSTLEQIAFTLQVGREAMEHRLALVVSDLQQLGEKLNLYTLGAQVDGLYTGVMETNASRLIEAGSLDDLARHFTEGAEIVWTKFYPHSTPNRISLPVYPFAKLRCWLNVFAKPLTNVSVTVKQTSTKQASSQEPVTGTGDLQEQLRGLFAEFLKVPLDQIKPDDNLQKFGFDSIIGMKMAGELEQRYGTKLSMQTFFEHSTIREMAQYLHESGVVLSDTQAVVDVIAETEAVQQTQPPLELTPTFTKSLSRFLLEELKAGRITPSQAIAFEERLGKAGREIG